MTNARDDLRRKFEELEWTPDAPVDPSRGWRFITEVLKDEQVHTFYVATSPEIHETAQEGKLQVVICAPPVLYEFLFGDNLRRYDVAPLANIYRIEEKREEEPSVEGDPRQKTSVLVQFGGGPEVLRLHLLAYGGRGSELSQFTAALKTFAFGSSTSG